MLRLLVLLLLLSNAGYFAWSHGTLAPYGFAPAAQSEPQRLAQQVRPEALRILTPSEARQLENAPGSATQPAASAGLLTTATPTTPSSPASSALVPAAASSPGQDIHCLQAGLFTDEQAATLRTRLQSALPTGTWALESSIEPARWMIYMGKYASLDALAKKRGELRQRGVSFEPLNNPTLEPGLSLGNFSTQLGADTELARIAKRGVKTAKVIQARTELRGQRLKLPAVTPALRTQLEAFRPQLLGKPLQVCR